MYDLSYGNTCVLIDGKHWVPLGRKCGSRVPITKLFDEFTQLPPIKSIIFSMKSFATVILQLIRKHAIRKNNLRS